MHKPGEPRERATGVKCVRLAAGGAVAGAAWTLRDAPCAPAAAEVQPASIEFEILRKALSGRRCLFLRCAANGSHNVSVPSQRTCGWRLHCTMYLRACCFGGSGRSARRPSSGGHMGLAVTLPPPELLIWATTDTR